MGAWKTLNMAGSAGSAGPAWRAQTNRTNAKPTVKERRAGLRLARAKHRPGPCNRYTAEQEQDRLIVQSIARDMLELLE